MANKHSKQRPPSVTAHINFHKDSPESCLSVFQTINQINNQLWLNKQTAPHRPSLTAAAPHNGDNRPAAAVLRFLCPAWATPGVYNC